MQPRLPHFLIGGAPKAGTTSLAHALMKHRDIFIPPQKELSFFHCENWRKGLGWYSRQFAGAGSSPLLGEATPDYLSSGLAAQRIAESLPKCKHIFVLRDPVARAISHYWFRWSTGREPRTLETVIADELRTQHALESGYVLRHGAYAESLAMYSEAAAEGRVLTLLFEELVSEPARVLGNVQEFLGVPVTVTRLPRENAGRMPRSVLAMRALQRAIDHQGLAKRALRWSLPQLTRRRIRQRLSRLLSSRSARPPVADSTKRLLERFYEPSNARLSEMLGLEMPPWPCS